MFRTVLVPLGILVALLCTQTPACLWAKEWEQNSPYYEDDAWYDVSEWLDGNDYNPTDEKFGRWDDEVYVSDSGDYDYDNDTQYGYDDRTNDADRWFYDYWNPEYSYYSGKGPTYDYAYRYYDYDNDGAYDSYTSYYDWDTDGWFEDVHHYTFDSWTDNDSQQKRQPTQTAHTQKQQERLSSKANEIFGTLQNVKEVDVRGTKHLIVQIEGAQGQPVIIDLGAKTRFKNNALFTKGARITVRGPMTTAGEKQILLAQSISINGQNHTIDRQARSFQGTIVDTHRAKVRGSNHTFAVLKTKSGKQRLIDLGRSDRLEELNLRKNASMTVRGVPFKIKNRPIVMAQSVDIDGSTVVIDRGSQRKS